MPRMTTGSGAQQKEMLERPPEIISYGDFIFCTRENVLFLKVHYSRNKDNCQSEFWKDQHGNRIKNVPEEAETKTQEISCKIIAMEVPGWLNQLSD